MKKCDCNQEVPRVPGAVSPHSPIRGFTQDAVGTHTCWSLTDMNSLVISLQSIKYGNGSSSLRICTLIRFGL